MRHENIIPLDGEEVDASSIWSAVANGRVSELASPLPFSPNGMSTNMEEELLDLLLTLLVRRILSEHLANSAPHRCNR